MRLLRPHLRRLTLQLTLRTLRSRHCAALVNVDVRLYVRLEGRRTKTLEMKSPRKKMVKKMKTKQRQIQQTEKQKPRRLQRQTQNPLMLVQR